MSLPLPILLAVHNICVCFPVKDASCIFWWYPRDPVAYTFHCDCVSSFVASPCVESQPEAQIKDHIVIALRNPPNFVQIFKSKQCSYFNWPNHPTKSEHFWPQKSVHFEIITWHLWVYGSLTEPKFEHQPSTKPSKKGQSLLLELILHAVSQELRADIAVHVLNDNEKIFALRMYCIDRAGVPESHDAHAFYCLYD